MSVLLPSICSLRRSDLKLHVCRACEKAYIKESMRRKYPSLFAEGSAEWNVFGAFGNTLLKTLPVLDINKRG